MTASEIMDSIRSGELKLSEFAEGLCDNIEKNDPILEIFVPGTFDRSRFAGQARSLEEKFPEPGERPPLYGLPVGVKDIIRVEGFETRCGSRLPASLFEGEEAFCVKRLKDAGAIVAGKTVTTEFAGIAHGPTRNPLNPAHTPGGSSSGSAAGVAAGFFLLALGTQTSGSVIRPAAFCGVVGFKPTLGRISTDGVIPFSFSTDHVGIFVPEIGLIDRVMPVLVDGWEPVPFSSRLGIPEGPYMDKALPEALDHFENIVGRIEKSGFVVRRIPVFDDLETIHKGHRRLVTGEITRVHREWSQKYSDRYRSRTKAYFVTGREVSEKELVELQAKQLELKNRIHGQMEKHEIDAWICPSATGTAPRGISSTGDPIMNMPWTNTGLPAVTIPCGTDGSGLPYGLQIVGKFMEDEKTTAIAGELEKVGF